MQRGLLPLVLCAVSLGLLLSQAALGQGQGSARLSLDECLRTALENNLDLVAAKKDPAIAEQGIEQNKAPFDGALSAGGKFEQFDADDTITDNVSSAEGPGGTERDTLTGDFGFSQLLGFGGEYSVTYNYVDFEQSAILINPATAFLADTRFQQTNNGINLEYSMPLLQGFGKEVNKLEILLARSGLQISKEDLRLQSMQTLQTVEDAYWDILAAREALRISQLALKRAEDLLELNKKKVEVGTLAPIEITEAEAGVAAQVEAVIVAENTMENAEDVLLQLMAVPASDPRWDQTLNLTNRPSFVPVKVDLDQALATAMERRPEMTTARQRLRDNELSERVAKRRVRHGLELVANVTPYQDREEDRFQDTLAPPGIPISDTSTSSDDTNWWVDLRYTYPLGNRKAKADYAVARLEKEKTQVGLQSTEQDIRVDVRKSARNLQAGLRRVEAAAKNVELQQKKLEAEQKKFDNGMSTSFEVLTFQNDLADAELAEIRAKLDYVKSQTALEQSKGTLLEARGLSLGE